MIKSGPYTRHTDDRGTFTGITREVWAEVNFIKTTAGCTRGDHYHRETRELFYIVSGEIDVEVRDIRTGQMTVFKAAAGDVFIIEPFENHVLKARTDVSWINMLSKRHNEQNPDFHRESETEPT